MARQRMHRLLLLGVVLGLGAAAVVPAQAADDEKKPEVKPCVTKARWIDGLKEACDEGGAKAATKLMQAQVRACKKHIKATEGAKAAAELRCNSCHEGGDFTKLELDEAGTKAIKARCPDVDW